MDSKRDIRNKRWLGYWGQMRKRGFLRYWMLYGVMYFVLFFLFILLAVNLFGERLPVFERLLSDKVVTNLLISLCAGMSLAIGQWIMNEIRYRRLGSKYPTAARLF